MILVLWDIDRTLVYTGDTDRQVYRELFEEVVGRPVAALPERGTGVTMPLAVRELLRANDVPCGQAEALAEKIVDLMPSRLARYRKDLPHTGEELPGAREALRAVNNDPGLVPTVVTGNLRGSAEVKLTAFGLDRYVDLTIGGFASDSAERHALVGISQQRAAAKLSHPFTRQNTVIIGDSLEDVRTGLQGGAKVISIASGTTSSAQLESAGADRVLPDLKHLGLLLRLIHEVGTA